MSYHHHHGRTHSISCTLSIRALVPSSQEQWKLFSGQVSPQPLMLHKICPDSHHNPPCQPHAPPYPVQVPEYFFQCIGTNFFHYQGTQYLVTVDRYQNWPIIEGTHEGSKIDCLSKLFTTFGIPDELASDSKPEFVANATSAFLKNLGVSHRLSSVAFPNSNCRAEIGVNSTKIDHIKYQASQQPEHLSFTKSHASISQYS